MRPVAIGSSLPKSDTQRTPNEGLGGGKGDRTVLERIEEHHSVLQVGVNEFGGTVALAADMGKPHPEVSLRVRRAPDSKGQIQRASLDMMGHISADDGARLQMLLWSMRLWLDSFTDAEHITERDEKLSEFVVKLGFKPLERQKLITQEEDAQAARRILEGLPEPQRTAFRQERARMLGVKPEDLPE